MYTAQYIRKKRKVKMPRTMDGERKVLQEVEEAGREGRRRGTRPKRGKGKRVRNKMIEEERIYRGM